METGWLDLSNAIIRRAIFDYKNAVKKLNNDVLSFAKRRNLERRKKEIECFFLSDYGQIITFDHGEEILERLKQETQ